MTPLVQCPIIECEGFDLLTNYTSEGEEPFPPFISVDYNITTEPPIDELWERQGCLFLCRSYISQDDADLCALRQSVLCTNPPDDEVWYSAPACCTVPCPDGTTFTYCVEAGIFIGKTYQEAYDQALAYACEKAKELRICFEPPGGGGGDDGDDSADIGVLPRCSCIGVPYSGTIIASGTAVSLTWSVVGIIPPGLTFQGFNDRAVISGTPTLNGTYAFVVTATTPEGNYATKTFTIQVLQVTTIALADFVIGTPYSAQLTAAGGSGNYSWRVATGTLPDGLTLSTSGLISGTPTALATGGTLTFEVVDETCESATKQFYTPRVSLITSGRTVIRTRRGWPSFLGDTTTLYKRIDYSGTITQIAFPNFNPDVSLDATQCAGAKFTYTGYDEINAYGELISRHRKDLSAMCLTDPPSMFETRIIVSPDNNYTLIPSPVIATLKGYCWDTDPLSCSTCNTDETNWLAGLDYSFVGPADFPTGIVWSLSKVTDTPLVRTYHSDFADLTGIDYSGGVLIEPGRETFPTNTGFGIYSDGLPFVRVESEGDWTATLSVPFTAADENTASESYSNSLAIAENFPDYTSYTLNSYLNFKSRTTTVNYSLVCTNLVVGEQYIVLARLTASNGATSVVSTTFTAVGTTHTVTGTVPTPAPGFTIKISNPSISYA